MKPSIKLALETLEVRCCPSIADVAAFQQQVPALHAELVALEPGIQVGLQQFVDSVKPQISMQQYQQAEWVISNLPALLDTWFYQQVASESAALLQIGQPQPQPAIQSGGQVSQTWRYNPSYQSMPGNIYYITPPSVPPPAPAPEPIDPPPDNPPPDEPPPDEGNL